MNLVLKTPPVIEPISLTEIKDYLRLSVADGSNGVETTQTITPGARAPGTVYGFSVEVLGYSVTVSLNTGTILPTGTINAKIQHSNDDLAWTDDLSFSQVTPANDNAVYSLQYTAGKRYIRVVAVVANAQADYSVEVQKQVGDTSEETYLTALITAAREYCEDFQNRAYITQTWEASWDSWPCHEIKLPKGKLQTVDLVSYKDSFGVVTELTDITDYVYSTRGILGRLTTAYGKTWPSFAPFPLDAIVVEFTCGYGDTAASVPAKVIQAMKMLVSHWYEHRTPLTETGQAPQEIAFAVSALLWMDRIIPI